MSAVESWQAGDPVMPMVGLSPCLRPGGGADCGCGSKMLLGEHECPSLSQEICSFAIPVFPGPQEAGCLTCCCNKTSKEGNLMIKEFVSVHS